MTRCGEEAVAVSLFDNLAHIHHGDFVTHMLHNAKIMADEEIGQPELRLKRLQQIQDLRLYGHIKRRDRLVADDQRRPCRQRACDADPLTLTARELVRKQRFLFRPEPYRLEQLVDRPVLFLTAKTCVTHRFANNVARAKARIER